MNLKEEFFNIYDSLPIEERTKVILMLEDEPISWNLAYKEIKSSTARGEIILRTLKDLEIL